MIEKFIENALYRIRERQSVCVIPLINNSVKTIEDYRYINGKKKGLEESEEILKQLYRDLVDNTTVESKDGDTYVNELYS